jgi:hypothetical protein
VGGLDRARPEARVIAALQQAASAGTQSSLRLLDAPPAWVIVLVILPLFAALAWIGYGRESTSTPMRVVLGLLRVGSFACLALVLFRPVREERREEVYPAEVLVLFDDSASMARQDAYAGDEDARRAAERLAGKPAAQATRSELARAAWEAELAPLLARGEYRTSLYSFAQTAAALADPAALAARGSATHLGDALSQTLAAQRGRNVTDIVILSDGRSNGGLAALEAARAAGTAGVPVHTVVLGDTRPEKNVRVELVDVPREALEGDELSVTVRIAARGVESERRGAVLLESVEEAGDPGTRIVAEEEALLTQAGERVVLVAPGGEGNLRVGEHRFRVSVAPLEGETLLDDNQLEFSVLVSPATIRVLYVDGYPRWEYRYLKNLLLRADARLMAQCFLLSATPDFPQESTRGTPALREVPTTREELLASYDVVILGDVNPYQISSDPARGQAFLHALKEFVEAGGGLAFQAGEYDDPHAFLSTELESVLPVQLDPTGVLRFEGDSTREFRPLLEDPQHPHEILRLARDLETNRRLWEDPDGLRGFYWYYPVPRAKPGAQVLLRHPSDTSRADGELYPLLVLGHHPQGRTLFLAVDSTWMWRYHYGDRYHEAFWRGALRWLALGRLKSGDRRYRLETSRSSYDLDERAVLEARVLDDDFRPSERAAQPLRWSGPDGMPHDLELERAADRPGVYRGTLQGERAGLHRAWIEVEGRRVASADFEVVLPSRENAEPAPDPQLMRQIAGLTGGRAVGLADLGRLADEFPGHEENREPISSRLQDAWDRLATLLVALGLFSAEWILRKRAELV